MQGRPLDELSLADFQLPVSSYIDSFFIAAKAVAPFMARQVCVAGRHHTRLPHARPGIPGAQRRVRWGGSAGAAPGRGTGRLRRARGLRPFACGAGGRRAWLTQRDGVRSACPAYRNVGGEIARRRCGRHVAQTVAHTLADVTNAAVFLASDRAMATTGAILNVNAGMLLD